MRNFVYIDTTTNRIKTSTHAEFDEAHFSQPNKPRGAQTLMQLGYTAHSNTEFQPKPITPSVQAVKDMKTINPTHHLVVAADHVEAIIPRQATEDAAGYDLYSCVDLTIPPDSIAKVNTGIKVRVPACTYGRIASRSGLVLKHKINTQGSVIDPNYTGCIQVILNNFGDTPFQVHKGDRIAQLILEKFESVPLTVTDHITDTCRGSSGFGSTGFNDHITTDSKSLSSSCMTLDSSSTILQACDVTLSFTEPCDILKIDISTQHTHPTLGLEMDDTLTVKCCQAGTPAAKIKQWRTVIKGTILHSINGSRVQTLQDAIIFFAKYKDNSTIEIQFKSNHQTPVHPESGTTQITFDQFVQIANHHQQLISDYFPVESSVDKNVLDPVSISKVSTSSDTLTRQKLLKQEDWNEWERAEKEQLDLYETQNMFSKPTKLPNEHGINVLAMIWVYLIKTCGQKKARCVANGNPAMKGSVTLANTYAAYV